MVYQLDLAAYLCPLPLLMTKKALASLTQGDTLIITTNQSVSLSDFTLLCHAHCATLTLLETTAAQQRLMIQKR